jgi:glycine cleavage system pyridoxal-binding protein P
MIIAKQRLNKQVPAEMNTHATTEEMQRRGKHNSIITKKLLGNGVFSWIGPEVI